MARARSPSSAASRTYSVDRVNRENTLLADNGIAPDEMRRRMRHVVSPVTVVTCGRGDQARGITIGSFVSTSLEPALVSFNLSRGAQMHDVLPFADDFLVHVLAEDQVFVSERFAIPDLTGRQQFDGIDTSEHESGLPVIRGTTLVLWCRVHNVFPAGDHSLIIGLVQATVESADKRPLVYFDKGYRAVGTTVGVVDGSRSASSSGGS